MAALRLYRLWHRVLNKAFTVAVSRSFRAFGQGSSMHLPIDLLGTAYISVGEEVMFSSGCIVQSHLGGLIEIGDGVEIYERAVITAQESVVIERGVIIGRGVHISDHTHSYDDPALNIVDQEAPLIGRVHICEGAWVANGSIVMPGVRIGKRAVVGAGSVVTADVPDYGVAVGAPARVVRTYAAPQPGPAKP